MAFSPALGLYRLATPLVTAYAKRRLNRRVARGKEHPDRLEERRGVASAPRPEGTLLWFHAASVGESLSILDLIENLLDDHPALNILVTTGTRTSAELLDKRLPDNTRHQFVPIDAVPFVERFLDHWRPDIAIWTESELWPALITCTARRDIPMLLLNARMSRKSARSWRWAKGMVASLLGRFDAIHAQDAASAENFLAVGADKAKLQVTGSLKKSGGALPHDEDERAQISGLLEARPVWLAASTHPGEEAMVAQAHRVLQGSTHRILLIIAPRHPERGPQIAEALRADGWRIGLRSAGDDPDALMDIYVADTLGEMGLWYRLAPFCFLGGSLVEIGGHNPFEPAALGSAILHGPHVESVAEVFEQLDDAGGARLVRTTEELGQAALDLTEPHKSAAMAHVAWEISSSGAEGETAARELIVGHLSRIEAR